MTTSPVSNLAGVYRHGQVFLTWAEEPTPPGTTFNVYQHERPITAAELPRARHIAHHIEVHSARDWWQDPASFGAGVAAGAPAGFRIDAHAPALPPDSGLFVHTVTSGHTGARYYAVTASAPDGVEQTDLRAGANTLAQPVDGYVEIPRPIWIGEGPAPAIDACRGKPLVLSLHGRGGGTVGPGALSVNYLCFGDATQGWREGLASKFQFWLTDDRVVVAPRDRAWTGGRAVLESPDARDHCPAINTFWYGYHSRIYETTLTEQAVAPNYTEEFLLWIVRWAQAQLGTDPNRTYIHGGSMGGCGAIAMAMHHPAVFAAVCAEVPLYAYTELGRRSIDRLVGMCGPMNRPVVARDGTSLLEHLNASLQAERTSADLPCILATNGRCDSSIPWENNPAFYAAMNRARQGLAVYWSNGEHGMSAEAPPDVRGWEPWMRRIRLDESFPAFSNCSDNRNYGNGDPTAGDLEGWINRGLDWKDVVDTADEYAITVTADYPGLTRPIRVDVTPRRLQAFKARPGARLMARVDTAAPVGICADHGGLFTVPGVSIATAEGTRIRVTRTGD